MTTEQPPATVRPAATGDDGADPSSWRASALEASGAAPEGSTVDAPRAVDGEAPLETGPSSAVATDRPIGEGASRKATAATDGTAPGRLDPGPAADGTDAADQRATGRPVRGRGTEKVAVADTGPETVAGGPAGGAAAGSDPSADTTADAGNVPESGREDTPRKEPAATEAAGGTGPADGATGAAKPTVRKSAPGVAAAPAATDPHARSAGDKGVEQSAPADANAALRKPAPEAVAATTAAQQGGGADANAATTPTRESRAADADAATTPTRENGAADADAAATSAQEGEESNEPADRWSEFAAAREAEPTRFDRVLTALGRFFRHEWTLACIAAIALAVAMTWPTLRYPQYELPQDIWDPTLQAWQMAWSGHILLTDPAQLYDSNAFYPSHWSFAFSDGLLGYAPFGMIGTGPAAAILRYNIVFVLAHALAALGAYALVRQLGAGRTGAAVAGVSYAYAPWLLAQSGHLHVLSNGGIPLAFAMLARGHGWSLRRGHRPGRRHAGWAAAGWITAAWQLSLGFGIGLVFAYVLGAVAVVVAVVCLTRRIWFGRTLFLADLFGGALFAATGGLLAIPFFEVAEENPNAVRSLAEIDFFSPPWRGFFTAPAESRIWGAAHAPIRAALPWDPEMTLLPGFILIGLALAGLFLSIWTLRARLALLAAVAVSAILAMGTRFFGGKVTYIPLFEHLPGWDGLRTPGRLVLWTTLLLGVLAAGAVSAFVERVEDVSAQRLPPWPGPWLRLATLIPLLLVLVEGLNSTPHAMVPAQPAAMRSVEGPLLVLPSDQPTDQNVMLWSTTRFQPIVNGGSGFTPATLDETRKVASTFPDAASIDYLRRVGVRNVIILRDRVAHTPWEATVDLPVDTLGIQRQDIGDAVVYRLSP
jgi:hypothetical protein